MSSAMDDVFGARPERPDHPDFWRLSQQVLMYDGRMQDAKASGKPPHEVVDEAISEVIDSKSLAYLATQRGMRVVGAETREQVLQHRALIAAFAALYTEAFLVGAAFEKGRT